MNNTMQLTAVLAITLGAILLLPMVNVSYADNSVKVYAKEKQGMMLLLVKNGKNANIHELTITLLDGSINSAKSKGWNVSNDSKNQVTIKSTNPIPVNGREIFFINTNNINSIISWTAKDRTGTIIAMDNARAIIKQTLSIPESSTYMKALGVTLATDKIFYKNGEKMLIYGVLEPNSKITITIYTPSGQKVKIGEETDYTGSFKALHVLHNAESGTYKVHVSKANASAETTFKVL